MPGLRNVLDASFPGLADRAVLRAPESTPLELDSPDKAVDRPEHPAQVMPDSRNLSGFLWRQVNAEKD